MLLSTLMKVSCARSSAISRSRTIRKISENTGRSYRRTSSRKAGSRPSFASAATSASGRLRRSRARAIHQEKETAHNISLVAYKVSRASYASQHREPRQRLRAVWGSSTFRWMSTITEEEEALSAAQGGRAKRGYVRRIFSEIAPRYDFLNHVLSANIDRGWRRRAIAALEWRRDPHGTYVDLCAGTLDIGAAIAREPKFEGQVIGADFAEPMLRAGAAKARTLPVRPVVADALRLPLADESVAGIIVAFGAR